MGINKYVLLKLIGIITNYVLGKTATYLVEGAEALENFNSYIGLLSTSSSIGNQYSFFGVNVEPSFAVGMDPFLKSAHIIISNNSFNEFQIGYGNVIDSGDVFFGYLVSKDISSNNKLQIKNRTSELQSISGNFSINQIEIKTNTIPYGYNFVEGGGKARINRKHFSTDKMALELGEKFSLGIRSFHFKVEEEKEQFEIEFPFGRFTNFN